MKHPATNKRIAYRYCSGISMLYILYTIKFAWNCWHSCSKSFQSVHYRLGLYKLPTWRCILKFYTNGIFTKHCCIYATSGTNKKNYTKYVGCTYEYLRRYCIPMYKYFETRYIPNILSTIFCWELVYKIHTTVCKMQNAKQNTFYRLNRLYIQML